MPTTTWRVPTCLQRLAMWPELGDAGRRQAVEEALRTVLDPELDEPLLDLGFLHSVDVCGDHARIVLRLPTYWCSVNFAYIMGEDIKAAVGAIPWIDGVEVQLVDHFAMEEINRGLSEGRGFREAFGGEAEDGLGIVRAEFREKSFLGRQSVVIQAMRKDGMSDEAIAAATCGALEGRAAAIDPERAKEIRRYMEARRQRAAPAGAADPAFVDRSDRPVPAGRIPDHLREIRRIRSSFEANGAICRMLHAARYGPKAAPAPTSSAERERARVAQLGKDGGSA